MLNARPVSGRFRSLRAWANAALMLILFAIPWIRIGDEPLVLLDIPQRQFHVFGLVIFPQELYFLWLILAALALSLFFFTALFGRLWCGWACPQTVFTDVFAGLARRIQGWSGSQPPARIAPWRKLLTHAVWLLASLAIGFHLVGYFHSPYEILAELTHGGPSLALLGFWLFFAAISYLDFVFVKQVFCKYLCPYARFQGVLFDRDTLVIGYDERRGEPRGKRGVAAGDCVDCGLCVAVCPSEIDIRHGLQLECIACTQCIDACNGVMEKLGRERDLIGYSSLAAFEGEPGGPHILRPRVVAYGALLVAALVAFGALLGRRLPMELTVARNRDSLYQTLANGQLGNSFRIRIENRDRVDRSFRLSLEDDRFDLIAGVNPVQVPSVSALETSVFVVAHADVALAGSLPLRFVLERDDGAPALVRTSRFLAPEAAPGG